jgi:hypothetical protein
MSDARDLYGLMAFFADGEDLKDAVGHLRREGYIRLDAYTPFPVDGLAEALGFEVRGLGRWVVGGGLAGGVGGFFMQWYANVVSYPINVGGRPLAAWPAFGLPGFELAVLGATFAVVGVMLWRMRLPRLNHPVFEVDGFNMGQSDSFFLVVESSDRKFSLKETRRRLEAFAPQRVEEIRA